MKYFLACCLLLFSHQFAEASSCHWDVNEAFPNYDYHNPGIHRPKKKLINVEEIVLKHLEHGAFIYSDHAVQGMEEWSISFDDVMRALRRGTYWEHLDSFGKSHRNYFGKSHYRWSYTLIDDESVPERPIKVIVSFYKKKRKIRMDIDTVMLEERLILHRPAGF